VVALRCSVVARPDSDRVNGEREGEREHAPASNLHEFRIDVNGVVELSFFDEPHLPWHRLWSWASPQNCQGGWPHIALSLLVRANQLIECEQIPGHGRHRAGDGHQRIDTR
jgi:hypothetical protein